MIQQQRNIGQAIDGVQHLRQAALVLLIHRRQQVHRLRQRFVAFGKLFKTFVNTHGSPRNVSIITAGASGDVSCMHGD